MRILVKIGGAELVEPAPRAGFARAVRRARDAGHELSVVHGGGEQIRALATRLGLAERRVGGLRVTDAATAEVVLAVLGGQVNRGLTAALGRAGVPAVGLSGADGALFDVRRHRPGGADLGYVGEVRCVDPALPLALLAAGYVPVVASVGPLGAGEPGPDDHLYNVNADAAAAPLAAALEVDALLFLTDVPGVRDARGALLVTLDPAGLAALEAEGALTGGMLPKVAAARAAAAAAPHAIVKIAPASFPGAGADGAILAALEPHVGTRVTAAPLASGQELLHG